MSKVTLRDVNKSFGDVRAVRDLSLEIEQGEFFSLLGPSGCGKTTTLRMVAGFQFPTSGEILFGDRDVSFLKPSLRNAAMVFQNFALFPHMTVFENVAFGLQARKVSKRSQAERVFRALELVDLRGLESRAVPALSGGQQQRVALARAIVIEPEILLLDEPLSNLDAKLREETRREIKSLQQRLEITTIYVTHDQEEALSLSDRIAVMNEGQCQQIGTPEAIYRHPRNRFVAQFVGDSNLLDGSVVQTSGKQVIVRITPDLNMVVSVVEETLHKGQVVTLCIRPENVVLNPGEPFKENVFAAEVDSIKFSGATVESILHIKGHFLRSKALTSGATGMTHKGQISIHIAPEQIIAIT